MRIGRILDRVTTGIWIDGLADRVADIGENVVVVGGNATGCESAHFIACMGTADPETFTFLMFHAAENPDFAKELLGHGMNETVELEQREYRVADVRPWQAPVVAQRVGPGEDN